MPKKKAIPRNVPVTLSRECNQRCLFCSAVGGMPAHSRKEIAGLIRNAGEDLIIGGWEPTLHPKLAGTVAQARKAGVKKIILFTNAVKLDDKALVRRLIDAGVNTFHINFPSHLEKLSDFLTQSPGAFRRRNAGIRNIRETPGKKFISLVFVINSLNYKTMPQYAEYVARNFPEVVHVLFTMPCVMGRAQQMPSLVPRLTDVKPCLAAALAVFRRRRIKCFTENVPLCFLPGFEDSSLDARRTVLSGAPAEAEGKARQKECAGCGLETLCPGPRLDYVRLHGAGELAPARRHAGAVARLIRPRGAA